LFDAKMSSNNVVVAFAAEDRPWAEEDRLELRSFVELSLKGMVNLKKAPTDELDLRDFQVSTRNSDLTVLLISKNLVECCAVHLWARTLDDKQRARIVPILLDDVDWSQYPDLRLLVFQRLLPASPMPLRTLSVGTSEWQESRHAILRAVKDRISPPEAARPRTLFWPSVVQLVAAVVGIIGGTLGIARGIFPPPPPPVGSADQKQSVLYLGAADFRAQRYIDTQAVRQVAPDGVDRNLAIQACFEPGRDGQQQGEVFAVLTRRAGTEGKSATYDVRSVGVDIRVPHGIHVDLFLKDDYDRSLYCTLPEVRQARWTRVQLSPYEVPPDRRQAEAGFTSNRVDKVGLRFRSVGFQGDATILVQNFEVLARAETPPPSVARCSLPQFRQNCGVELRDLLGPDQADRVALTQLQQGTAERHHNLVKRLQLLGHQKVHSLRVALFPNVLQGLDPLDSQQRSILNAQLQADVKTILDGSARYAMRVSFVLFDFGGSSAANYGQLIGNPAQASLLHKQVLKPLLERCALSDVVLGIEVLTGTEEAAVQFGDERVRDFAQQVQTTARSLRHSWTISLGYGTRQGMEKHFIDGFDVYSFCHDPVRDKTNWILMRRDLLSSVPPKQPVIIVTRFPGESYLAGNPQRQPFVRLAMGDAFDLGYSGILFSLPNATEERVRFQGNEAKDFAAWPNVDLPKTTATGEPRGRPPLTFAGSLAQMRFMDVVLTSVELVAHSALFVFAATVQLVFVASVLRLLSRRRTSQTPSPVRNTPTERRGAPYITTMLPAYQESESLAATCRRFVETTYPADRWELLVLTEEDDKETCSLAQELAARYEQVRYLPVPRDYLGTRHPRNKPRALSYGLGRIEPHSEVIGVIDAEDRVPTDLLDKVAAGVQRFPVVQGRLAIANDNENLLTLWLGAEYAFVEFLQYGRDALGWMKFARGSSYFARREVIEELGWSTRNLTEDLVFNVKAYAEGYEIGLIDTTTWEEAPRTHLTWLRQRTRWLQGTLQTLREGIDKSKMRFWKRVSMGQLLLHVALAPLILAIMTPMLLYDQVVSFLAPRSWGLWQSNVPGWVWIGNWILLALVCCEFAAATMFAYRGQKRLWPRVGVCLGLPWLFMVLLPWAGLRAIWRQIGGAGDWEKTPHRGETLCSPSP
jgi:cellulose synthase/poly-beta-1,6-N-acetylglucosamine synthase-like glycosyltransferase